MIHEWCHSALKKAVKCEISQKNIHQAHLDSHSLLEKQNIAQHFLQILFLLKLYVKNNFGIDI